MQESRISDRARNWLELNNHRVCGVTFLDNVSRSVDLPLAFNEAYALVKAWYRGSERRQVMLVVFRDGSFKPFYSEAD